MTLPSGSLLHDRYRIDEVIARGGMGAIYRAFDLTLNIDVAVKENFYEGEDHARQFRREATILAGLRHPNLPRVTDHFTIPGQGQYLVMDYIEGEDLRHLTNRSGPMAEADVVRVGCAVSDALDYLHHRQPPVVHRDIKPGNIRVTPAGGVFLVDFGLAKISQAGQNTTTGAQALTPGYAPPEQYGQGTEPRSDIYALGATLYAVLSGKVPEDGLARAMGTAELTPLRVHAPTVSVPTAAAIEKAMSVAPINRFQTGGAFRDALCAAPVLDFSGVAPPGTPSHNQPPSSSASGPSGAAALPSKFTRKFSWLFGGLALMITLLVGVFFIFLPGLARPPAAILPSASPLSVSDPPLSPTTSPLAVSAAQTELPSQTPPSTFTPEPTATFTPAATPIGGGGEIAFASDRSGIPQVWAMQPDGSGLRQITKLADGACQPDWDAGKKRLVFISPCRSKTDSYPGASLYIIQADGSGLLLLPTLPGGDYDPDWSPDGKSIAFTSLRSSRPNIYVIALADNSVVRLSSPVNYERRPAWSPDGAVIAYETTRAGFPQIWVMQADGKEPREFSSQAGGRSYYPAWSPDARLIVYTQGGSPTFLVSRQTDNPQAVEFRITDQLSAVGKSAFSPDGWWITAVVSVKDNLEIFTLVRNGSRITRLTNNPAADFDPSW